MKDIVIINGEVYYIMKQSSVKNEVLSSVTWRDQKFIYNNNSGLYRNRGRPIPVINKYVETLRVGDIFTLEMFFKEYPKQRKNLNYLPKNISGLIKENILLQLEKDKFKVVSSLGRDKNTKE